MGGKVKLVWLESSILSQSAAEAYSLAEAPRKPLYRFRSMHGSLWSVELSMKRCVECFECFELFNLWSEMGSRMEQYLECEVKSGISSL